jgi:outer membrane protein assembly factor BamA
VAAPLRGAVRRERRGGVPILTPSFRPSITGQIAKRWTLSLGYEYQYFQYIENQIEVVSDEQLPLDIKLGHYTNTQLSQTLSWDTRNDLIRTTSGGLRSVTLLEASQYLGGDFNYLGILPDLRGYLSLRRIFPRAPAFTVLATPLRRGVVGAGRRRRCGVRAVRRTAEARRLEHRPRVERRSPRTVPVLDGVERRLHEPRPPASPDPAPTYESLGVPDADVPEGSDPTDYADTVPVGGLVSFFMSFELRKYWGKLGGVLFSDIGMVWADPSYITQVPLAPSVGTGFRYQTPVGALRFDIAARLADIPMLENEQLILGLPLWFHFALGEAF